MADNQIKFYRGDKPADLSQLNPNAIYFFTDSKEIYTGGKTYGMSGEQTTAFNERIAALQGEVDTVELSVEEILKVLGVIEGYEKETVLNRLDVLEQRVATDSETIIDHGEAIDNLTTYVGVIPENSAQTNVIDYIEEQVTKALEDAGSATAASVKAELDKHTADMNAHEAVFTATKTELNARIEAVGVTANAVKDDLDAFKASAEIGDAAIDTLKEIQDYITSDGSLAAEMVGNIEKAQQAAEDAAAAAQVADEKADAAQSAANAAAESAAQGILDAAGAKSTADAAAEAAEVADGKAVAADAKAQAAQEAIEALEEVVDGKAAQSDLTALTNRVGANETAITTLQEASHSHANKEVLDGITDEKIKAWDAAKQDAIEYADRLLVWNSIEANV